MPDHIEKHKRKYQFQDTEADGRKVKQKKHDDRSEPKTEIQNSFGASNPPSTLKKSLDKPQTSQKIRHLIIALDEALEEDGRDEILDLIGDEALKRCLKLQKSLSQYKSKIEVMTAATSTVAQPISPDTQNVPKTLSPTSITPWRSSTIPSFFPPVPKVLDPTLEKSAFVHLGVGSGSLTDLTYERLEWIGDAYIELIATLLISQTFPSLGPGRSSQIRERLVKNLTLAKFSRYYGFDRRAQLPNILASASPDEMVKIHGDIFEAYVAAVILSDPTDGLGKASGWLKDLWAMEIKDDISKEERLGKKIESPLWRLRGTSKPVQDILSKDHFISPKEQLNKLIACKMAKITYKDAAPERKDRESKLIHFTVGVYFDGWGEKNLRLGVGEALSKKDAGNIAASIALENKQLMDMYAEKKRAWGEQRAWELEQEGRENNATK